MEHEEGAAVGGAPRTRGGCAPDLDCPRTPTDPHRAAGPGETCAGQRQDEGADSPQAAGVGGAGGEGRHCPANQTDPGSHDQAHPGCSQHSWPDCGALWQVQGVHVPGDPGRLLEVVDPRNQRESKLPRGPGAPGDLGKRRIGPTQGGRNHLLQERAGERSGSSGPDTATKCSPPAGDGQFFGRVVEASPHSSKEEGRGGDDGERHRGRQRRLVRADPGPGEADRSPEEAAGKGVKPPRPEVAETYEAGGVQHLGSDEEPVGQSIYETGGDQYQGFELEEDSGLIAEGAADHTYEPGGDQESASEEDSLPPGRPSRIDDFEVIEDDNVTSSGNETMSPRARARHGIRRRRAEQRTNMRKVRDGVMNVFQILMATSVMLAGWAESVVDEPLWEVWALTQPRHHVRDHERSEVDCLEIFAGEARISSAFARHRRGVLEPRDLRYDHDCRLPEVQEAILEDINVQRPGLVWMAPPCTLWCNFSRLNYPPQQLRRLRQKEKVIVDFTAKVFEMQNALGGLAIIENPRSSDLWRHPDIERLTNFPAARYADLDMCQYSLTSSMDGRPLKKAMSLLTNNEVFANAMGRKCHDAGHDHRPIQGKDTSFSSAYPTAFANAVVRAYDKAMREGRSVFENFPTETPSVDQAEDALGAEGITFKGKVKPMVASTLRRIHQNLGHPPNRELIRHLRLSGASEGIVRAAEQMQCRTCDKHSKPRPARVTQPHAALDFNQVVAIDIIWLDTCESQALPALNCVDMSSTYQVVIPLTGISSGEVGASFVDGWISWAGAPKNVLADLDSAFKDKFLDLLDRRCTIIRCSAGQAHWQNGLCERHGSSWKAIWSKLVEDYSILDADVKEACAAVNDAKNGLRSRAGYSPRQWVFGGQLREHDLFEDNEDIAALYNITNDEAYGRRHVIRMGARASYYQAQSKDAIAKAIAHKSRVTTRPFDPGELVYVFREGKGKRRWIGPCSVIGREGQNYWVARGGRCLLVAPEHLREAKHEEVSEGLPVRVALRELKQLMRADEDDDAFYELDSADEIDAGAPAHLHPRREEEGHVEMDAPDEGGLPMEGVEERAEAIRAAARKAHVLDDVPVPIKKFRAQRPFFVKRVLTQKGREKQLDKELPCEMIPQHERPAYEEAELKQWQEHLDFGAVRALSLEQSQEVERTVDSSRILNCRFLYRDKNRAKRRVDPKVPLKAKARLCVAGQNDPDLGQVDMVTDAPTTSRHALLLALQLSLARKWTVSIGDIRAAFLNGLPAPRTLYFRQPRRGMPTLEKGQLIEIIKGVFGLSTSPKLWWMKLSGELTKMQITYRQEELKVKQNPIDPCAFMIVDAAANTRGWILTHVDDLMLMAEPGLDQELFL